MKVLKVVVFIAIVAYSISAMNDRVKGEGLWGSFLGIVVLIVFFYLAYELFFISSKQEKNEITKNVTPKLYDDKETDNYYEDENDYEDEDDYEDDYEDDCEDEDEDEERDLGYYQNN